jgi:hypothetical protein
MNRQCLSLALLFSVGFAGAARADALPPDAVACFSGTQQAGSPCTFNGPGICQNATCTGIDKLNWDRDASATPPTIQYSCVKCIPTGAGTDSGCAVGGRLARTVGPWLVAGLFAAGVMLARRRPRR